MGFFIFYKRTSGWWHSFNNGSKEVNLSDFNIVLDAIGQTVVLQALNGSNIPKQEVAITDVQLIDETDASAVETFATVELLRTRLEELHYTPYINDTGLTDDELLAIQNANSPSAANPFATMDDLGGGGGETTATMGVLIGSAGDATPNDTDYVATALTAGGLLKKITWTNVKAFLKTYFDTVYTTTSAVASQITTALSGYLTAATAASTYQTILGFTPENVANKENSTLDNDTDKYPTNNLVRNTIDGLSAPYIEMIDFNGAVLTSLANSRTYVETFTSATKTNELYYITPDNWGVYRFSVPIDTDFDLANEFCGVGDAKHIQFVDKFGLARKFGVDAFALNLYDNVLGRKDGIEATDTFFDGAIPKTKNTIYRITSLGTDGFKDYTGRVDINKFGVDGTQTLPSDIFTTANECLVVTDLANKYNDSGSPDADVLQIITNLSNVNSAVSYDGVDSGGGGTVTTYQYIRQYLPTLTFGGTNLWMGWNRNTSTMLTLSPNVSYGTGTEPTKTGTWFPDSNVFSLNGSKQLTSLILNIRETATSGQTMQVYVVAADYSNSRGSEANGQIIVNDTFTINSLSSQRRSLTILSHSDFATDTILYLFIRCTTAAPVLQGFELIFKLEDA